MVKYQLLFSPLSKKDVKKLSTAGLDSKAKTLLNIIQQNPYAYPPPFELLKGNLKGLISRKNNRQHRLVYRVLEEKKIVKVVRMWTHYGE